MTWKPHNRQTVWKDRFRLFARGLIHTFSGTASGYAMNYIKMETEAFQLLYIRIQYVEFNVELLLDTLTRVNEQRLLRERG
jgi:hypothetical protein